MPCEYELSLKGDGWESLEQSQLVEERREELLKQQYLVDDAKV